MRYKTLIAVLFTSFTLAAFSNKALSESKSGIASKKFCLIRKAVYGNLADSMIVDVTEKVRAMVKEGRLNVEASDDNFGDPYNGTMNLTIIKATAQMDGLNFGGGGDVTDQIRQSVQGNRLTVKMTGMKVTVVYRYGKAKRSAKEQGEDGLLMILPPTKLQVDYTLNGIKMSKTVDIYKTLKVNSEVK